jgi:hypothetical protein
MNKNYIIKFENKDFHSFGLKNTYFINTSNNDSNNDKAIKMQVKIIKPINNLLILHYPFE